MCLAMSALSRIRLPGRVDSTWSYLVIAADESIQPQTREHFDICRLLEIPRGIVVITKRDLVDDDMTGLVKLEMEELVAGSFLEGAPMVSVAPPAPRPRHAAH